MTQERALQIQKIFHGIKDGRDTVTLSENELLEAEGWKRTCATPFARWMWMKRSDDMIKLDGHESNPVIFASTDEALIWVRFQMESILHDALLS